MRRISIVFVLLVVLSQYLQAGRYYDARIGRFLQIDPMAQKYAAWSPYSYGLDNPLKNIDVDGRVVKVYTERLGTAALFKNIHNLKELGERAIAYSYLPRHSFMRVTTDKVDVIIELGGPKEGTTKGVPIIQPADGVTGKRVSQEEHLVNRPQGVGEKDYEHFENRIIEIYNAIKDDLPDYNAIDGPNCNGFIKFMIEAAGGSVFLPDKAVGKDEIKEYWDQYKKSLEKKKQEEEQQQKKDDK